MNKVLITGTAGFIGFHLAKLLLKDRFKVHGYDGITDYYDINLKIKRHNILSENSNFTNTQGMLEDVDKLNSLAEEFKPDVIVHLAAQAGVRYSIDKPKVYFNRWDFFDYIIFEIDKSKPFYEFGVWRGHSFEYLIRSIKTGFGFDTFEGLPTNWHLEEVGKYSNQGQIPKIKGGNFIKGKFK